MASYPRNHLLLTVEGDAWAQQEIWQFGLHFDSAVLPANTAAIDAAIAAWFTASNASEYVRYIGFKAAIIAPDGKYPPSHVPLVFTRTQPLSGSSTNGQLVPQASLAVTLTTALARGRGHAGRIYPPPMAYTIQSNGQILDTTNAIPPKWVTFLNALITAVGARLVIASQAAGTFTPVTGIRLGKVVDTQRKRRNHLPESYVTAAIVNPPSAS